MAGSGWVKVVLLNDTLIIDREYNKTDIAGI